MKKAVAIAAAWLPFFVLWLLFGMQMGATFRQALPHAFFAIAAAALLGLLVSRLCAAVPLQLRPRFYLLHLVTAALFAATWGAAMLAVEARTISRSMLVGWFLEGIWIYAIIAGASYAYQTQRRALQAEKSLAVARLDALRSRLHPHFLFNALHTVGALVRHDPAEAENAVEKLGDMLRYTLRDGEGDAVTFAEEWEFTRRYLEFEQLRYGDRLRVKADIDPQSLQYSAPSFALQTLVENAVHHSIDTRAEGGTIEIRARVDADRLHVSVRDDGNGHSEPGTRYGLAALRERLQTVYGTTLDLQNGQGFEVSFTIPCEL
ncbi:MAG TPA: histidine kinase [Thermoanaerobaculia bacterium]|nr:histidine kinase [Thermoanaerobaculia bacterium]